MCRYKYNGVTGINCNIIVAVTQTLMLCMIYVCMSFAPYSYYLKNISCSYIATYMYALSVNYTYNRGTITLQNFKTHKLC